LKWNFQKDAAKNSVNNLVGVIGVINNITIKPESHDEVEKKGIERALERNWQSETKISRLRFPVVR